MEEVDAGRIKEIKGHPFARKGVKTRTLMIKVEACKHYHARIDGTAAGKPSSFRRTKFEKLKSVYPPNCLNEVSGDRDAASRATSAWH